MEAAPGDLDRSFSADGKVTAGEITSTVGDVAIQPDGKIVVAGTDGNDVTLFRYNSNGTLDSTFSGDGKVTTAVGTTSIARAVAIQFERKIVVAGSSESGDSDILIVRYNSDGSLDTTFRGNGIATFDVTEFDDRALDVAIQSDGKIVVVGTIQPSGNRQDIILLRLNSNGSFDNTFSGDGRVVFPDLGDDETTAIAVAIQSNNKIVVAGQGDVGLSNGNFFLARYNSNGELDNTFGQGGLSIIDLGHVALPRDLAIQSDGKIVVSGVSLVTFAATFLVLRTNSNGTLDNRFGGGNGFVDTHFPGSSGISRANAVAIQADGKILAAGVVGLSSSNEFALARYNSNGTLDATFSSDGILTTDFSSNSDDDARAIAIQKNDGRIVVAGFSSGDFALARYHAFECNGSNVTILGTQTSNTINGTSGNDVIQGLGASETINGGIGDDIICGGDGNDNINGGANNDTLLGQGGDDALDGGSGTDACNVGGASMPPTRVQTTVNCESGITGGSGFSGMWLGDVSQTCNESEEDPICTLEGIIEVVNPGTETAPISTIKFSLSFDEFLDEEDVLVDEKQIDPLDSQEVREVSLFGVVPPGEDAIGRFIIALLDADDVVLEVREDNNEVVSAAIVGEGSDGGVSSSGCSIARSSTPTSIPLYLLVPVFVVMRRLWRRYIGVS
ncbi:MAG: hypothetical protein A2W09_00690 [Deltaproteobacteria bacterium RBG_16_50_11]|nr:MAG: hypothetical protein A2W09_00690 [Deltaproteobacteria bacterium RBG_16_50_11]